MNQQKNYRILLILALISAQTVSLMNPGNVMAATESVTHTSDTDFVKGTLSDGISVNDSPGNIRLEHQPPSHIYTTIEDFASGTTTDTEITETMDGEITLGEEEVNFEYTNSTEPPVINAACTASALDHERGIIYIGTGNWGLTAINTKGTISKTDDTLVANYTKTSSPALLGNSIQHLHFDDSSNLLYVSTSSGLSVINTQGTISADDDTIAAEYSTTTVPVAIASSLIRWSDFDESTKNLLYIASEGALSMINTQGTITPDDDVLITEYNSTSVPPIASDLTRKSYVDKANGLIYITTFAGLSVINTNKTINPADDTLLVTYTTLTTPPIGGNATRHVFVDELRNLVYVSTEAGLSVINTQGTLSPDDDTLVINYTEATEPALPDSSVQVAYLIEFSNTLVVGTNNGGAVLIDTKGSATASDDELIDQYSMYTDPALPANSVYEIFFDELNNLLHITSGRYTPPLWPDPGINIGGETVIKLYDLGYTLSGTYSNTVETEVNFEPKFISWTGTKTENQEIAVQTRSAVGEIWRDDFNDNLTDEYLGDYYDWGYDVFTSVEESNGTMKLSDPVGDWHEALLWIDTGKPDEYFPVGSTITARVRFNSNTRLSDWDYMFTDEWMGDWYEDQLGNNNWYTIYFTENTTPFSKIGFYLVWVDGTWNNVNDSFEIDWIKIELPFGWTDWSEACTTGLDCPVNMPEGSSQLQYNLTLTTSDSEITPVVESITLDQGFQASGVYQSPVIDSGSAGTEWTELAADMTLPEGTNASVYTRSGDTNVPDAGWSQWEEVNSPITSPDGRYLQYQIILATSNELVTPYISSITVEYNTLDTLTKTGTSISSTVPISVFFILYGILKYKKRALRSTP